MRGDRSVVVRKRPLLDEFDVPAVRYEIRTDAAEPMWVRLVESLPRPVTDVDIAFAGERAENRWSVRTPDTLVYENTVQRGSPRKTAFAVATSEGRLCRTYMDEPAVETATGVRRPAPAEWGPAEDLKFHAVPASALRA